MFGLFKKKKTDHLADVVLLTQIFKELGDNFTNFQTQLEAGLIVGSKKTNKPFGEYTSFAYNVDVLNKYEDKQGRILAIRGVCVFDSLKGISSLPVWDSEYSTRWGNSR